MAAVTICSDFGAPQNKVFTVSTVFIKYTVSCIYLVTYRQGKAYKLYSKYYSQISSLQGDLTLAFVDLSPPSFYFLLSNSYIEI